MLASSVVDRGFEIELLSGKIKVFKIGICCFSANNTVFMSTSKDWMARNRDNVFEWSEMYTNELFQ